MASLILLPSLWPFPRQARTPFLRPHPPGWWASDREGRGRQPAPGRVRLRGGAGVVAAAAAVLGGLGLWPAAAGVPSGPAGGGAEWGAACAPGRVVVAAGASHAGAGHGGAFSGLGSELSLASVVGALSEAGGGHGRGCGVCGYAGVMGAGAVVWAGGGGGGWAAAAAPGGVPDDPGWGGVCSEPRGAQFG